MGIRQTTEAASPTRGRFRAIKEVTFDNDTGTINLFTVTGDVVVHILAVCKTSVTSAAAANIRLGIPASTDSIIGDTLATGCTAGLIWNDQTPGSKIEPADRVRAYDVTTGENIALTLDGQVDTGAITFYLYWTDHGTGASVVSA
jgi:hypothetical protein